MRCPFCKQPDSRVIDSRAADEGTTIRRRRECSKCGRRFTTYEVVERLPLMVVKRDNRREPFSRDKLLTGRSRTLLRRSSMRSATAQSRRCRPRRSVRSSWRGSRISMKSLIFVLRQSIENSTILRILSRNWRHCAHTARRNKIRKAERGYWIIG